MKSFSNMQCIAIMSFGICLNMILHKLSEYLFMAICLIMHQDAACWNWNHFYAYTMSWKEVRLSWQIVLFPSKEAQEHSWRHPKEHEVMVSPVKALRSVLTSFTCDPQIPRLRNLILLGVSHTWLDMNAESN